MNLEEIIKNGEIGEYWLLIDKFYHRKFYNPKYPDLLISFLKNLNAHKVLDASCGIGFPSLEVVKRGFLLTCSDGSESMLKVFKRRIEEEKIDIPILHSKWSELPDKIKDTFDVVLCLDSSITYVDSWSSENEADIVKAKESIQSSLGAFYKILNSGGYLVIGLGKYAFEQKTSETIDYGSLDLDGNEVHHKWILGFDYQKKRKIWHSIFVINGREYTRNFVSYMLTGDELESMLEIAGFGHIKRQEIVPDEYDVNIVAQK